MAKIIRLTENDLTRIVKRVIKEQSSNKKRFVPCSQLGVKSMGYCEAKTKKPVDMCSKLGVKTPGVCYIDTKQPVPKN